MLRIYISTISSLLSTTVTTLLTYLYLRNHVFFLVHRYCYPEAQGKAPGCVPLLGRFVVVCLLHAEHADKIQVHTEREPLRVWELWQQRLVDAVQ